MPERAHPLPPGPPETLTARAALGVGAAILGALTSTLASALASFAQQDLQGAFGTGVDQGAWLSASYAAAEVAAIPSCRWLAAVVGVRRYVVVAATLFSVVNLLLPFAVTPEQLIALRIAQGFTGGVLTPMTLMCVIRFVPVRHRIWGIGLYAFCSTFSPAIAGSLDGWVTETWGWAWVFWLLVFPGALIVVGAFIGLPGEPSRPDLLRNADWFGIWTAGPAMALLAIGVSQGDRLDWFNSALVSGCFVAGIGLLAAFLVNEWFQPNPLYQLRLLGRANFAIPLLVLAAFRFALLASSLIMPQYLGRVQGLRALQIGDVLLWLALPQLLLPFVVVPAVRLIDARLIMAFGLAVMAAGCFMGTNLTHAWAYPDFVASSLVQAIGEPFIMVPLLALAVGAVGPTEGNWAGAMVNDLRSYAGTAGIGLMNGFVTQREHYHSNVLTATLPAGNGDVQARLGALAGAMRGHLSGAEAQMGSAVSSLAHTVQREAFVMAYADAFLALGIIVLAALVASAFLKPARVR